MITTSQALAKKQILDLINVQMDEMRTERNLAMLKVSSLRMKFIQSEDKDLSTLFRQTEDAEIELKMICLRSKALEEATLQINHGFGW